MKTIDCSGSSNLEVMEYDPETKTLRVTFKNGGQFLYKDVPLHEALELENADSKGSYFSLAIKNNYPAEKL